MRRAAKVDTNHAEIREALRKAGCSVLDLSRVGSGCPDLLVARSGRNVLLEIKRPKVRGQTAGKLEPLQVRFMEDWRGPVYVVYSIEEALCAMGLERRRGSE